MSRLPRRSRAGSRWRAAAASRRPRDGRAATTRRSASSLIRIGSTITSRCARCCGPISIATRSWHRPSAPAGWPSTPARVARASRVVRSGLDRADDRARRVVAADLREPLVDLLRGARDRPRRRGSGRARRRWPRSPAWRSWSSPRNPSSISAGEVCSALQTPSTRPWPLDRPPGRRALQQRVRLDRARPTRPA